MWGIGLLASARVKRASFSARVWSACLLARPMFVQLGAQLSRSWAFLSGPRCVALRGDDDDDDGRLV